MSLLRQGAKLSSALVDRMLSPPPGPRLLIYHRVGLFEGKQIEVRASDFEWQLDWLCEHRNVVHLAEALERWSEPGSEDLTVLTFDDGYIDTFTTAFPLLLERRLAFTLYLATEMIEAPRYESPDWLDWDSIGTMLDSGLMTLGAHTHTHLDLRGVELAAVRTELDQCDELIERRLGLTPVHFAYPWGYWDPVAHTEVILRYQSAVLGAPLRRGPFNRHEIPRFPVQFSEGRRWFEARLRGGLRAEEWVRRRMRQYDGPP